MYGGSTFAEVPYAALVVTGSGPVVYNVDISETATAVDDLLTSLIVTAILAEFATGSDAASGQLTVS